MVRRVDNPRGVLSCSCFYKVLSGASNRQDLGSAPLFFCRRCTSHNNKTEKGDEYDRQVGRTGEESVCRQGIRVFREGEGDEFDGQGIERRPVAFYPRMGRGL